MRVILLNGPPRSGKDTAGEILAWHGAYVTKFAKQLKEMVHRAFDVTEYTPDFKRLVHAGHERFEATKDQHQSLLRGATPRAAYIQFSEDFMKPLLGEDIFGRFVAKELVGLNYDLVAVTDSGFKAEAEVLLKKFDCILIRLHRSGCDFDGDSRSYLSLPGVPSWDIVNDGTVEELERKLVEVLALSH